MGLATLQIKDMWIFSQTKSWFNVEYFSKTDKALKFLCLKTCTFEKESNKRHNDMKKGMTINSKMQF